MDFLKPKNSEKSSFDIMYIHSIFYKSNFMRIKPLIWHPHTNTHTHTDTHTHTHTKNEAKNKVRHAKRKSKVSRLAIL